MMSKRMKLDQVINLLDDMSSSEDDLDEKCSESCDDENDETEDEDNVPLSVLMAKKNQSTQVQTQPVLNKVKHDHDVSTESSDDDMPLAALARKTIRKPFQQQDINIQAQPNTKFKLVKDAEAARRRSSVASQRKVNTYLRGLFDSIELESDEEDEYASKENTKTTLFKSDSPVLNYDRSVTRFVLSLKNSKRKSTT